MNLLNTTLPKYQLTLFGLFSIAGNWWGEPRPAVKHLTVHRISSRSKNHLTQMSAVSWLRKHSLHKIMLKMLTVLFIYKPPDFLGNMAFWLCDKTNMYQIPIWAF